MASAKARDIPEEQQFFTDLWNWRKKYYYPEDNEKFYEDFVADGIAIGEKYGTEMSQAMVLAIIDEVQKRGKKNG